MLAECCLLRQGFEAQDGLGGPRSGAGFEAVRWGGVGRVLGNCAELEDVENEKHLKGLDGPSPGLSPKVSKTKRVLDGERSDAL